MVIKWSLAIQCQHDLFTISYPNKQKKLGGHQVVVRNVMLKQPIGHWVAKWKKKDLVATKWSLGEKEINDLMATSSSSVRRKKRA